MTGQVELFQESIELLQHYGKCLANDTNADIRSDLEKLCPVMMDICDAQSRYLATENLFNDYIDGVENSDEIDAENILKNFKIDVEKTISKLPLRVNNKTYIEIKESMVMGRKGLDDSEIATISETLSTIDPITKLPLTDPVKNIKCGHIYEKSSILHLLKCKHRKVVKCPIAGCIAADGVTKNDLVPDVALKRYLDSCKKS